MVEVLVRVDGGHPISFEDSLPDEILEAGSPDVRIVVERGEIVRVSLCDCLSATHSKRHRVLRGQLLDFRECVEPLSFCNGRSDVRDGALAKLRIRLEYVYH